MSSIGPQIPPNRKRALDTEDDAAADTPSSANKQARTVGPTLPPTTANQDEIDLDDDGDSDDDFGPSASALVGPAQPAANKDEIDLDDDSDSNIGPAAPELAHGPPHIEADESDSDSDDDYGPALPGAGVRRGPIGPTMPSSLSSDAAPTRDAWMIAPPTATGYTERDTTKLRARKFASKTGPSDGTVSAIWTETPEEKLKRLQDSVLGRQGENSSAAASTAAKQSRDEEERNRRISASINSNRGQSLYDEHQDKARASGKDDEEDDPSKRAFDREKDMALGSKIGAAQRQEFVNKAANFGGRFQKGSYL